MIKLGFRKRKEKSTSQQGQKYYDHIENCPIWNYDKATTDLRYLLILDDYSKLPKTDIDLTEVYIELTGQIIDTFGLSNKDVAILEKESNIVKIRLKNFEKPKPIYQVHLKRLRKEIESMRKSDKQMTLDEGITMIEIHWPGMKIDPQKTTVLRYHNYLKSRTEQIKRQIKAAKAAKKR